MANIRVKLVRMNGGCSPGEENTYYLPDDENATKTFIVHYTNERRYEFLHNLDGLDSEDVEILVELTRQSTSTFNIVLQALYGEIYIEPGQSPSFAGLYTAGKISVPCSTDRTKHYIHLRPDDTIDLRDDGVKVAVMLEIPNSTSTVHPPSDSNDVVANQQSAEVQVKSSNAGSELDASGGDNADDETDASDDDLDKTVTDLPTRPLAVGEITPATARTINQTIMETPRATTTAEPNAAPSEDNQPYSTANEGFTSDTVILDNVESPIVRAQANRTADAGISGSNILPLDTVQLTSTPLEVNVEDHMVNGDVRTSPDPNLTSEYEPKDVAAAAASASVRGLTKRKLSDVEDSEDADEIPTSSKKRKTREPKVVREQHGESEAEGMANEMEVMAPESTREDDLSIEKSDESNVEEADVEEADLDEDVKPAKSAKKGKLSKPQSKSSRRIAKSTSSRSSQQRSLSPAVVITGQRSTRMRTSDTPASSMASSTPTGKTSNVLCSSDSPLRKAATANFLKSKGALIIDDVKTRRAHFVCVLNGSKLTTTAKVLRSIALGKLVVTEDWVAESKKAKQLLAPEDYIHPDLKPTMHLDRSNIFKGTNLFFTKTLAKAYGSGWKAIQELGKEAGANQVVEGDVTSFHVFRSGKMPVICFGQKGGADNDVKRLQHTHKVKVYHKDLLTQSIMKGELDMDGEEHVL